MRAYRRTWVALFACAAGWTLWVERGASAARRIFWGAPSISASARREPSFVAVAFSRLTSDEEPFAMSARRFEETLDLLRAKGYASIGLSDVEDFYRSGRLLPRKALLIALDRDDPESIRLADGVLMRARMRALVFLDRNGARDARRHRYALSPHAMARIKRSGAWDLGWFADSPESAPPEPGVVLDLEDRKPWTRDAARYPVRFAGSRAGYNDARGELSDIRLMRVRPDLSAEEIASAVEASWPRERPFSDGFQGARLGMDWVPEWGVIAAGRGRLELLPAPRQTGASVGLSGTRDWRDLALEFDVRKYKSALWAYARYGADGRFARVGARDGYWYLQQKPAAGALPASLARERIGVLPARVRIVLKGRFAIVDVDGRRAFGGGVELSTSVDKGRVAFGVFDERPHAAMGELSSVAARPLGRRWLSLNVDGTLGRFDPEASQILREESVFSYALSPRWLSIGRDGRVRKVGNARGFVRQLAGFNRCLLVPMAFLSASRIAVVGDPPAAERLMDALVDAAAGPGADGLNLRVPAALARRAEAARFVPELARRLRAEGKRLWVTLDGPGEPPEAWLASTEGLLRPGGRPLAGVERLYYDARSKESP